MFIVIYNRVRTKALSIFYRCFPLVRGLLIVTSVVDLPTSLLIIRGFFNKENPLGKALIIDIDKSIFWIYK
jgi:hypothetical protein